MTETEERRPGDSGAPFERTIPADSHHDDRPIHQKPQTVQSVAEVAHSYKGRGWAPIPIPLREKAPRIWGWPNLRLSDDQISESFGGGSCNIGILLGGPSGGLSDIDLDCVEALELASEMLPATNSKFGRSSKRRSHLLYRVQGPAPSITFKDPLTDAVILELRADGGRQTIFPGSIHPSGERIEWDIDGEPAVVDYATIKMAATRLAAHCLIRRYFPKLTDDAGLLKALETTDPRLARRIREWRNLPGRAAPAPEPNTSFAHLERVLPFPGGSPALA